MKKLKYLSVLVLSILLNSCETKEKVEGDYNLLPLPQEMTVNGSSALRFDDVSAVYALNGAESPILGQLTSQFKKVENQKEAQVIYQLDENLDIQAEGYVLEITDTKIHISAKDNAGLLYGFMTLEQLLEDAKEQNANLPLCNIKDYPALAYRAIHVDVKHHLEKTEYYYKLMDKLAHYKVNAVILEAEDKIKYKRQPKVGSLDALSIEEWQKISEYAKARNIEISPLIQGLGHASFVLKHEEYKELRDNPESDWAFNPLDPKTYDVQFDLYLDAIEATPNGKYLHIGGDEVHTTGRGSGKSALELQLDWLSKVCKFAEEHNRIPIFWDDMPLKHAGVYHPMFNTKLTQEKVDSIWDKNEHRLAAFLDVFPKNCIYMRWNYSSPDALGNSKAMNWFRKHDLQVMGATAGQTRWTLMPQNHSNIDNISSFATSSIENGLNGLLLTLWDDDSPHFELYMRGIVAFSEYTWSGKKRTKTELKTAYRHREFSSKLSDVKHAFIDDLEGPVGQWKNQLLEKVSRNNLKREGGNKNKLVIDMPSLKNKGEWSKKYASRIAQAKVTMQKCDTIASKIEYMQTTAIRNNYTLEVYNQVNNLVAYSSSVLTALNNFDTSKNKDDEVTALTEIKKLSSEFKKVRSELETVYAKTRILSKPDNYILDQDHHTHIANQSLNFDWLFWGELYFLEKLEQSINNGDFEK